ncbi:MULTISPECIES: PilZ domain-containing protein [Pseudomonas]|uniref:PilZ domain-containing protein n=1 Tax=Pseudomonas TaxID=286 RepID=UPI0018AB939F|nr:MULTISPECIES: PilZ domain-containing protein [Pseudomonas]MBF8763709.1 PilZ domain-containing protein [Pseudomonas putida]MBH3342217.1 PilZ domain-containing protein [Pseudomonas parafulva]MEC4022416.1 PilZ domain-containing protein [Pseudomonas fulva]
MTLFNKRLIDRHQLPFVLKVFNRFNGQEMGQLGNASENGMMLISELPVMVGPDYELQLRLPLTGGGHQFVNLTASCLWCREDQTPGYYDSGFMLLQAPREYDGFVRSLQEYFSFRASSTSV